MKLPQTGGCQCGKVRYEIAEEPQSVYTCHCLDCQRLTSSAFSLGIVVSENGFHLMGLEPRRLQRTADSGRVNIRLVCPECGSWVCGPPRDGAVRVRGGTLDDTSWLRPTRHIWTRRKQAWVKPPRVMKSLRDSLPDRDETVHDRARPWVFQAVNAGALYAIIVFLRSEARAGGLSG
jgi:hypothetical protein